MYITMHKAGSTVHDRVLQTFVDRLDLVRIQMEEDQKNTPLTPFDYIKLHAHQFTKHGYYFGPYRGNYFGPHRVHYSNRLEESFPKNRIIFQVRDPRDCLCSWYFSMGWSHSTPKDPAKRAVFMERRQRIQDQSIDEHVLKSAYEYNHRLRNIALIIDNHDDWLLLKYEDMVLNTNAWIQKTAKFLGVTVDDHLRQQQAHLLNFNVESEDLGAHKRQVMPGDHKRKLKPETIELLNRKLGGVLRRFGYW